MTKFLTTRFGQSLESRIAKDSKPKEDDTGIIALLRDLRNEYAPASLSLYLSRSLFPSLVCLYLSLLARSLAALPRS